MDRGSFLLGLGVGFIVVSILVSLVVVPMVASIRVYVDELSDYVNSPYYYKIRSIVEAQSQGAEYDPTAILNNIQYRVQDLEHVVDETMIYGTLYAFIIIGVILVIIGYLKKRKTSR